MADLLQAFLPWVEADISVTLTNPAQFWWQGELMEGFQTASEGEGPGQGRTATSALLSAGAQLTPSALFQQPAEASAAGAKGGRGKAKASVST